MSNFAIRIKERVATLRKTIMEYILSFRKLRYIFTTALCCLLLLVGISLFNNIETKRESKKIDAIMQGEIMINDLSTHLQSLDYSVLRLQQENNQKAEIAINNTLNQLSDWKREILSPQYNYLSEYLSRQRLISQLNEKIAATNIVLQTGTKVSGNFSQEQAVANIQLNSSVNELRDFNKAELNRTTASETRLMNRQFWLTFAIVCILIVFLVITSIYTTAYVRDIKKKEEILHYNASLIKNISDPIITTDAGYIITNWNLFAENLLGYTEEEARGKHLKQLLKIEYPHTEISEMMEFFITEKDWRGEATYYHKNGTAIPVDVSSSVIRTSTSQNRGVIFIVRDMKAQKQLNEQLSKLSNDLQHKVDGQNKELAVVFDRVADAFIAIDNELNYTFVNETAAFIENAPADSLIGQPLHRNNSRRQQSKFYQSVLLAKATQETRSVIIDNVENQTWHEAIIYPSPEGMSIYFRDITESNQVKIKVESLYNKLHNYIKCTPLAVIELDAENKITLWNDKAQDIFGWLPQDVIGKPIHAIDMLYAGEDIANIDKALQIKDVLDKDSFTCAVKTKQGEVMLCHWHAIVLKSAVGERIGTMLFAEDITEEMLTAKELQNAEGKFRNLVEQSMVGVYIIQDERLMYVNPTFARIFGYEAEEMMTSVSSITIVHPSDRDKVAENIRSRIRQDVKSINYQFKGITKQEECIYVEVFGSFIIYKGKPAIIGSVIDITERIHFLEKIEASRKAEALLNNRFLLAAKATRNAMWDWDMTTNQLWANHVFYEIIGVTDTENFKTEDFIKLVHPEDRRIILNRLTSALKERLTHVETEFRLKIADGNYVIIHNRAYFIYDEKNWGARILGAFEDVTEKRKAEIKLKHEKDLSDTIINSLPGIFYLIDEKGYLKRWNRNFEKVTGYSSKELSEFKMQQVISEDAVQELTHRAKEVFAGDEGDVETTLLTKNKEEVKYQLTGTKINYEDAPSLMGVGIDISERSRIQTQLIKSEEKYRMLIEQASDGIYIKDAAGNLQNVNSSMSQLTGYTKKEMLQLNVNDIYIKTSPAEKLKVKEMKQGESVIFERVIRKKNGEFCHVEVNYKMLDDGSLQGIVRDITFRKAAEEALKISESKYRILFDKNPLPMFILDLTTQKFLDVNTAAQEFYKYPRHEFLDKNLFDLMSNDNNQMKLKDFGLLVKHIQKGGIYKHYTSDGKEVSVNTIIHDIMYEGQVAKLIVASDETDKLIAAEKLKKSSEELRQLASHLEDVREAERTHMAREIHDELGQQLTGLKMDISWLSRRLQIEDDQISQKVKDIISLIDKTVITVRRLATELRPSILDDLGLISAMEWQSDEFQKRSEIKSIFSTNDPALKLNSNIATNIFRIFQESLTNVSRHSKATEVISNLINTGNEIQLEIQDNGKGFNPAGIEGKKTLGLLGMRERVNLMGGSYNIHSKPGQGTLIKILIPIPSEVVD